jgi:DNA polymerase III sliding clamp (beta) subunit (PCNA family)
VKNLKGGVAMRVAVAKQDFSKALTLLGKVADRVASRHPSGWVKLTAGGGVLQAEASNREVHLVMRMPADVKVEGAVCVGADDLILAMKSDKNKKGVVELSVEGDMLAVVHGDITQKLSVRPLAEFYVYPSCEYRFSLPADVLKEGINKVMFAIDHDEKYRGNVLNNLFIHGKGEYMNFVGSNGYMLAVYKVDIPFSDKLYIYNEGVEILQKLLKEVGGEIKVCDVRDGVSGEVSYVCFSGKDFNLAVRVVVGYDYPDYESILPLADNWNTLIEVYSKDLEKALNNFKKFDAVVFELTESSEGFRVYGEYDGYIIEAWVKGRVVGKDLKIGFKPKQLLEYLKGVDRYIHIKLLSEKEPVAFHLINDERYAFVVMPVLLRNS